MATVKKPAKRGRPSGYSDGLAASICHELAMGRSLRAICDSEGFPSTGTVLRWLAEEEREEFRNQYARAREAQADRLAAEIIEIADETEVEVRYQGETQVLDVSSTAVARNRLRVDARKWYASKLAPKKYGEKLAIGGAEDLPPVAQQVAYQLDDAALMAIASAASKKA